MEQLAEPDIPVRRRFAARFACAALNLLQPGLGLIRIGMARSGLLFMIAPVIWLLLVALLAAVSPTPPFAGFLILGAATIVVVVAVYGVSIRKTWCGSVYRSQHRLWWSRWYALAGLAILGFVAAPLCVGLLHRSYKPFYLPSEAMAPTLGRLDRIIARMNVRDPVQRGDIVLIATGRVIYVKRVIALSGDRVAIRADNPVINGAMAQLRTIGLHRFEGAEGIESGVALFERLPGEGSPHMILRSEPRLPGEMSERIVPSGHIFVLGDNRDRSADSRFPKDVGGLDMVPIDAIIGRPLYLSYSHLAGFSGRRVDR